MSKPESHPSIAVRGRFYISLLLLLFLVLVSTVYSISIGQVSIPFGEAMDIALNGITGGHAGSIEHIQGAFSNIVMQVRMPRVIFAFLVGVGLALCGVVMQASVQNPLADPYILGVSSGAALGATFAILVGFGSGAYFSQLGIAFGAFAGAVLTSFAVFIMSSIGGRATSVKLVLSGVVVGALCSSFSSLVIFFANSAEGIQTVTFWTMGSLASASWPKVPIMAVIVAIGCIFFLFQHRILNTMLLGDEAAITLGINLSFYRKLYLVITALLTGTLVAYTGMIGFVGLVIPHITRSIFGSDHKHLLPGTLLVGGLFMIWADVLSRVLIANIELPIGIITSVIGSPVFIYIIIKRGYNFGG